MTIHGTFPYSDDSALNTLEVWLPDTADMAFTEAEGGLWVVYIHGGAWRDPSIDSKSFVPILEALLKAPVAGNIAGYASINYRLSPYPSRESDPSEPSDPSRNARHPDHINDVLTAILFLQEKYHFEDRYVLVGHSCGATLAYQVAMKRYWSKQYESTFALELNVVPPLGIVGLEGIYDIPALVHYHREQPMYRHFVVNAFGEGDWSPVSPTKGLYNDTWPDGRLAVVAHSPNDTLVEMEQPELMLSALKAQGWDSKGPRRSLHVEMKNDHDEVWKTGEAAEAIVETIRVLSGRNE